MALSAFGEKTKRLTAEDLHATLGPAYAAWCELLDRVAARIPAATLLWGFTSERTGWSFGFVIKTACCAT
jgi:hypothetical protein